MNRAAGMLLALVFGSANAATFTVTNLNDSGPGSLRQAVIDANGDTVSDTINFSVTGTIVLTSGQMNIITPMTITGPGAGSLTIDGNQNSRIFSVFENVADVCTTPGSDFLVTISGLTLTRGWRTLDSSGGALYSEKSLTLDSVIVTNSEARAGGGLNWFAIYTGQELNIRNSTFSGNLARDFPTTTTSLRGGGLRASERCATPVTSAYVGIFNSNFLDNHARPTTNDNAAGGGMEVTGRFVVDIYSSRINGNSVDPPATPPTGANYRVGGIRVGNAGSVTIFDSEISDNAASRASGLTVYNNRADLQDESGTTSLNIFNSTISGNNAYGPADSLQGGHGGGLALTGNVRLEMYHSTLSNNSAAVSIGGIALTSGATDPPGPSNAVPPVMSLYSTIVSGNGSGDIGFDTSTVSSVFVGGSYSLTGNLQTGVTMVGPGNLVSNAPLLGPLAFNGGPTQTMALLAGSPAIDTGNNVASQPFDQRGPGFPRTIGPATDIGAYEYSARRVTAAAPVPTLSEYALAALALLTAIAGFAALRRRA